MGGAPQGDSQTDRVYWNLKKRYRGHFPLNRRDDGANISYSNYIHLGGVPREFSFNFDVMAETLDVHPSWLLDWKGHTMGKLTLFAATFTWRNRCSAPPKWGEGTVRKGKPEWVLWVKMSCTTAVLGGTKIQKGAQLDQRNGNNLPSELLFAGGLAGK